MTLNQLKCQLYSSLWSQPLHSSLNFVTLNIVFILREEKRSYSPNWKRAFIALFFHANISFKKCKYLLSKESFKANTVNKYFLSRKEHCYSIFYLLTDKMGTKSVWINLKILNVLIIISGLTPRIRVFQTYSWLSYGHFF